MREYSRRLCFLIAWGVTPGTILAQDAGGRSESRVRYLNLGAGYAHLGNEGGLALTGAVAWMKPNLFSYFIPADITVVPGEQDDRYYMDTFSNGQSRCRDSVTGQFADTAQCQATPTFRYAAAAESNLAWRGIDGSPFVGAGVRFGVRSTPYLTVGAIGDAGSAGGHGYIRASAGRHFFQVLIGGHW